MPWAEWKGRCTSPLQKLSYLVYGLDGTEVLRSLRNIPNMDRPEHHITDCLKERGVGKGSRQRSTLLEGERSVLNQTGIGTVSRAALGRHAERRCWARVCLSERYGAILSWKWNLENLFPSTMMPSWTETGICLPLCLCVCLSLSVCLSVSFSLSVSLLFSVFVCLSLSLSLSLTPPIPLPPLSTSL